MMNESRKALRVGVLFALAFFIPESLIFRLLHSLRILDLAPLSNLWGGAGVLALFFGLVLVNGLIASVVVKWLGYRFDFTTPSEAQRSTTP